MPLFIFIPSEAAIGGDLFGVPLAPFDTENHIPINGNIVFGIGATGTVIFDYSSLSIKLNGTPVVTAGVPTAGYAVSLELGVFYNVNGLILSLNPPSNLSSFTTYTVNIDFTTINLKPYSMYYTFTTSNKISFGSNLPFGNTNLQRYYFSKYNKKNSQAVGNYSDASYSFKSFKLLSNPQSNTKLILQVDSLAGIGEKLNQYLGDYDRIEKFYDGYVADPSVASSVLNEQGSTFSGLSINSPDDRGNLYSQIDARMAESMGQTTPFPSMLGPRFGAKVINAQVGNIKIQQRPEDE